MASRELVPAQPIALKAPIRSEFEDEDEDGKLIERKFIAPAADKAHWFARFDATGVMAVCTLIAWGHQPVAIAVANEIPVMWFQEWIDTHIRADDLKRAERIAAQMLVTKSMTTLDVQAANQQDATMRKEFSSRLAWGAERLDRDKWGAKSDGSESQRPVVLNLNFGGAGKAPKVITARPLPIEQGE